MKQAVLVAAALAAFVWPAAPAQASAQDPMVDAAAGAEMVARVNDLRAGQSLPAFTADAELTAKATDWAATMARAGRIWHSELSDGITADWAKLGENVGMGSAVDALHRAFVASPRHYENLVAPDFDFVGIGAVRLDGTLYVAEVFMRKQPVRTPAPAPAEAAAAPATPSAPAAGRAPVVRPAPARRRAAPAAAAPTRAAPRQAVPAGAPASAPAPAPAVPAPAAGAPAPAGEIPLGSPQPVPAGAPTVAPPEVELASSVATPVASKRSVASGMATVAWAAVTVGLTLVVRPRRRPTRRGRPLTFRELRDLVGSIPRS